MSRIDINRGFIGTSSTNVIVVVKKTFRYSNVFFYNHLCRTAEFRNIIMENGINCVKPRLRLSVSNLGRSFAGNSFRITSILHVPAEAGTCGSKLDLAV
jgi:hypothetical protein